MQKASGNITSWDGTCVVVMGHRTCTDPWFSLPAFPSAFWVHSVCLCQKTLQLAKRFNAIMCHQKVLLTSIVHNNMNFPVDSDLLFTNFFTCIFYQIQYCRAVSLTHTHTHARTHARTHASTHARTHAHTHTHTHPLVFMVYGDSP